MSDDQPPSKAERMQAKFDSARAIVERERLPGWEAFFARDAEAEKWTLNQEQRVLGSLRHEDEVIFERALGSWVMAWERVNERLAEEYRVANEDPETWELRYIKWMKKIVYIKFGSPMGDFYLVPKKPRKKPKAAHWYTVDEMLGMLNPAVVAAIEMAGSLPVRPETLPGPEPGEKHMLVDMTGPEMRVKYTLPKGNRR